MSRIARTAAVVCAVLLWLPASASAAQNDPRLDGLFAKLQSTKDDAQAQVIEDEIWSIWLNAHDAKVNALMVVGMRAMQVGDLSQALADFNEIIKEKPDFAEGWNKRATVYYMLGRYDASIADCMKVLKLEPRHFGALSGLGLNYDAKGNEVEALAWYRKALEVDPHLSNIAKRVKELTAKLEGESI